MIKIIEKLHDWMSRNLKMGCEKLPPEKRLMVVLMMFFCFALIFVGVFANTIYKMGIKEGEKNNLIQKTNYERENIRTTSETE